MRILHYYLGPAPLRSGGLTKYVEDLMEAEKLNGDTCLQLYPLKLTSNKRIHISKTRDSKVYQLVNAYPLPLTGGIKTPEDFWGGDVDVSGIRQFLKHIAVDIIHIHTLMGLPIEFLQLAKQLGLKIVYTTHDYFGLSPVPDFFDAQLGRSFAYEQVDSQLAFWQRLGSQSSSTMKLRVFQLPIYVQLKKIAHFISQFRSNEQPGNDNKMVNETVTIDTGFRKLFEHYRAMFRMVDVFHFNSRVSQGVFLQNMPELKDQKYMVIPITNSNIRKRNLKQPNKLVESQNIRVGYLGRFTPAKGVYELVEMFKKASNSTIELHLFGDASRHNFNVKNVYNEGAYISSELTNILDNLDVVVVPSIWEETFGFVPIECVTNGVPVLLSRHVGAEMLFTDDYQGKYSSQGELLKKLNALDRNFIKQLRETMAIQIPQMLDVQQAYRL
ncbi:glycosyltransferase [Lactiplantibacillus plantarum]|nr:glycosyltransferase [Lactiplantibacillus plantarum UCMA 3037]MCG0594433.1 glycosyltransferase [Lactiplantibacillus plantarum]MCG0623583.1 glycosyltransferase [Lactiplantibacillus plantarum]MCG0750111.1 glycosyltransferase [Lactiplantibacillus plantarum]MCG0759786.1 glycosyltransferase [Lactiplantibacillus plantarum]